MIRPSRRNAATPRARGRRGFSLVELIVAMVLLVIGVMGLVAVSGYAIRQASSTDRSTVATLVAQSRMERLRSLSCGNITNGTATTRGIAESWTVTAVGSNSRQVTGTFTYTSRSGATQQLTQATTILCVP